MALTFAGSVSSLTLKSTMCSMVWFDEAMILVEKDEERGLKEREGLRLTRRLGEEKERENGVGKNVRALRHSVISCKSKWLERIESREGWRLIVKAGAANGRPVEAEAVTIIGFSVRAQIN